MKKILFRAPVMTASGYGVHSRMLLKALMDAGRYDITVVSVPWGNTPLIYEPDPFLDRIRELSNKFNPGAPGQYDLSIQVTIPNEFGKMAPLNVGVTAGIEVDRVSPVWVQKSNEMDLLVVPSTHAAQGFRATGGLKRDPVVVPEWVDASVFNTDPLPTGSAKYDFPAKFNFLAVGLGLDKPDGEDRKNITGLVRWFCEQFNGSPDVGLVLKVGMVNNSPIDFKNTRDRIANIKRLAGCGQLPRVHLIHGRLSDRELAALYKNERIGAFVSLTHGEGYGLPILEAAACGLPIVATSWSGHLDFLHVDGVRKFVPVEYELKPIPESFHWKDVMDAGTQWAWPSAQDAKLKMAKVVMSPTKPRAWAEDLAKHIGARYTEAALAPLFVEAIEGVLGGSQPRRTVQEIFSRPEDPRAKYAGMHQFIAARRAQLAVPGKRTLLYTMPGSAGDVFVSTAVVSSLRKKFPEHHIYFATSQQYLDILKENPDIDAVIPFDEGWMANTRVLEFVFDEVFCPNYPVQTGTNNWIMNGRGRRLAEQFANHCLVELGEYRIKAEEPPMEFWDYAPGGVPMIVFHPGAGTGQWGARSYRHWQAVVDGINEATGKSMPIVQVGSAGDAPYAGVADFRGKTTYNQLAYVIRTGTVLVGIDSLPMHIAAALGIPHVNIFGSSTPGSTGPAIVDECFRGKGLSVLLETPDRFSCTKPCYLSECIVDPTNPCINNIAPERIVGAVKAALQNVR